MCHAGRYGMVTELRVGIENNRSGPRAPNPLPLLRIEGQTVPMSDQQPAELVGSLATGFMGSRCLHVAVSMGLAETVTDNPRSMTDLAAEVGADSRSLGRLMRHLAALGVFECSGDSIRHNEASRLLRRDHPSNLSSLVLMMGIPVIWGSLGNLEDAVRTGRPGTTFMDPNGFFSYLAAHPDESELYDRGMTGMTVRRISRMVPHYDFTPFDVIADIGGGRGHLLRAVLEQTPAAQGILFDQPHVVMDLPPQPRMSVEPGSFFTDSLPRADCYLLSNVIHDWGDDEALSILNAVRSAADSTSTLLLFEFVVPEDAEDFTATDIDMWMLALVSGRERTYAEYSVLLTRAGWQVSRTVPTPVQTIIEAIPAA